jgi:hypothetical protein
MFLGRTRFEPEPNLNPHSGSRFGRGLNRTPCSGSAFRARGSEPELNRTFLVIWNPGVYSAPHWSEYRKFPCIDNSDRKYLSKRWLRRYSCNLAKQQYQRGANKVGKGRLRMERLCVRIMQYAVSVMRGYRFDYH